MESQDNEWGRLPVEDVLELSQNDAIQWLGEAIRRLLEVTGDFKLWPLPLEEPEFCAQEHFLTANLAQFEDDHSQQLRQQQQEDRERERQMQNQRWEDYAQGQIRSPRGSGNRDQVRDESQGQQLGQVQNRVQDQAQRQAQHRDCNQESQQESGRGSQQEQGSSVQPCPGGPCFEHAVTENSSWDVSSSEPPIVGGEPQLPYWEQAKNIAREFDSSYPIEISLLDYLGRLHRYCPMSPVVYVAASLFIHRLVFEEGVLYVTHKNKHKVLLAALSIAMKNVHDIKHPHRKLAGVGGVEPAKLLRLETVFCFLADFRFCVSATALQEHWQYLCDNVATQMLRNMIQQRHGPDAVTLGY